MSPETIPFLLCGVTCILPILIGTGSFFAWCQITNRFPAREISNWKDDEGRTHVETSWTWLTREEKKFRNQKEEEE